MLDVIVTVEDVLKGQLDLEMYLDVAKKLGLDPREYLVLEDFVNCIKSVSLAGLNVVVTVTPFKKNQRLLSHLIESRWFVNESKNVNKIRSKMSF